MTIVNKKCLDCGKDFEYDEKPGYPRKYCFSCSAERKKSYTAKKGNVALSETYGNPKTPLNVPLVKVGEKSLPTPMGKSTHTTMYVSYAKDIFCALISKEADLPRITEDIGKNKMRQAIELVKQARGEFE